MFFLYKNLSFKTGITGFGECYRYVFFLLRFDFEEKSKLNRWYLISSLYSDVFLSVFCLFIYFFYQNITDIKISLTPQIGSHGHKKKLQIVTRKATVR